MDRRSEAGFTLIEMIVVLVVLALVGSIVLSRGPLRSPALDLRATARAMAATLRGARSSAIATDRDVRFTLDPVARSYGIAGQPRHALPASVELPPRPVALVFHPDGSTSGATVPLAEQNRRIVLRVDWLTGAVSLRDG